MKVKSSVYAAALPKFPHVRPDEFLAMPNHATSHPNSLLTSVFHRFPFQPDWPEYPKNLVKDARLEHLPKGRSELLLTDDRMWRFFIREAIANDIRHRMDMRRELEREAVDRHVEHYLSSLAWHRMLFFKQVKEIMQRQTKGLAIARQLQLALFEHMRAARREAGLKEGIETRALIKEGFERRAKFLAWRLDNLFGLTASHGTVRLKGHGQTLEHVIAHLLWDLRHANTERHHKWRLDTLYAPLPNGGIVHIHGSTGKPLEHIAAKVSWPVKKRRTDGFEKWHDLANVVATAGNALHHMRHQGSSTATALVKIDAPKAAERDLKTFQWHLSRRLETLPNGGFLASPNGFIGAIPEKVTGDVAWGDKRHVSHEHHKWQISHGAALKANGGFETAKDGGVHTYVNVTSLAEVPKKEKVTAGHKEWQINHGAALKANGGFETARDGGVHTYINVTSLADVPKKEKALAGHKEWHKSHQFGPTPNAGMAPLKNHGRSYEAVSAETAEIPRRKQQAATDLWHSTHQFKPTSNDTFVPVKNAGQSLEGVTGNLYGKWRDTLTQKMLKKRLSERYVATSNGSWARIGRAGQPFAEVVGEVARPTEGPGAMAPLPAADGHIPTSAEHIPEHQLKRRERRAFRDIQRSLAAHEQTVSRLHGHVIRPSSVDQAVNAETLPVVTVQTTKKTS